MAKILSFPRKNAADKKTEALLKVSDEIDNLIATSIFDEELDPRDIAGLLAHRLGALIRQLEGGDLEKLLAVCQEVMQRQAHKNSQAR